MKNNIYLVQKYEIYEDITEAYAFLSKQNALEKQKEMQRAAEINVIWQLVEFEIQDSEYVKVGCEINNNHNAIDRIIDETIKNPYKNIQNSEYSDDFIGDTSLGIQYTVSCYFDLSLNMSSLCMMHIGQRNDDQVYIVDLIKNWKSENGNEIKLKNIEDEIIQLRNRFFNISIVNFDQFASYQLIQNLKNNDFNVHIQSIHGLKPYVLFMEIISKDLLRCYGDSDFIDELKELIIVNKSRKGCPSNVVNSIISAVYSLVPLEQSWTKV